MTDERECEKDQHADTLDILRGTVINFGGYLARGGGRIPFIFTSGNLFGAVAVGHFATAAVVIQIAAAIAAFGMKKSLFEALHRANSDQSATIIFNGLVISAVLGVLLAILMVPFVGFLFPEALTESAVLWILTGVPLIAATDIFLVGTLYKKLLRYQVLGRSVAEPWTLSLLTIAAAFFAPTAEGLIFAYVGSLVAAFAVAGTGFWLHFFRGTRVTIGLDVRLMVSLVLLSAPTALVDIIDNVFRRLDLFVLSIFFPGASVGIYFLARQIAFLIQNIKQGFDPILAPVIAGIAFRDGMQSALEQLARVSRWIFTLQIGLVIALAIPSTQLLGFLGSEFAAGGLILILLLVAELIDGSVSPWELAILYTKRNLNLAFSFAAFAVYAVLCVVLTTTFGGAGAAAAFVAGFAFLAVLRLIAVRYLFEMVALSRPFLKPVFAGSLAALAGTGVVLVTEEWPLASVGLTIATCLAVYAMALKFAGVDEKDRMLFARLQERRV